MATLAEARQRAREAAWTVVREAEVEMRERSPSAAVGDDRHYCVAIADADGTIRALSRPILLGAVATAVRAILDTVGELSADEITITNDPAAGALHVQDFTVLAPLGDALGYAVACLHTADFGGDLLGGFNPRADSVWAEGAVIAPLRVGELGAAAELRRLLEFNTRLPDLLRRDLEAALTALGRLRERAGELVEALADAPAATSARVHELLAAGRDGSYRATTTVAHCCTGDAAEIALELTLADGAARLDLTGSAPAATGFVNASAAAAAFATLAPLVDWLEPAAVNAGLLDRVALTLPPGSVVAPPPSSPTGWGPYGTAAAIGGLVSDLLGQAGLEPCSIEHWTLAPPRRFHMPACDDPDCPFGNRGDGPPPVRRPPVY